MKPIISVIIPCYNGEATIKRCITSVVNQTFKELEIIIIDDGSTDNTYSIACQSAEDDKRIHVIKQQNTGQGYARNLGMESATGKYIGFVDCDDTIEPDMYKSMLMKIEESNAEVVQCNLLNVFENGTRVIQLPIIDRVVKISNRAKYFSKYIFKNLHSYECCNKLIRLDFLISNDIKFSKNSNVYSEDLLFNLELALKLNTIAFIGDTYYNYYQYTNSHSKYNTEEKIKLLMNLFKSFEEKIEDRELILETGKLATLIILLNLSHIIDTDSGHAFARQILKNKDLIRYIRYSFIRMKLIHHKLIMFYLMTMPINAKIRLIKVYYENMK